ncbi:CDP-alcohol phosphatidyltransferase family protein [Aliicoccus persicus]|uniref:CDP-diacylglycerol--glycerol-3-phosphate 3-phosphatidyltransferase n=1 Tax=Aliicoccus persicus TaxID=930138 RepID=A0A662Z2C8_9STAP|nr:CDP-alcohol phosphatidyltransferase family protein [Aliicoccus persicus]SEV94415.1 CDP-diacylglycerol--glycerol-3-phosphate 3-phosphatidyltransferase [Aliicoccus persicus]
MASIYEFKPKFQQLLLPVVRALHERNITPNQVTIFTCILSIIVGVLFAMNHDSTWIFVLIPIVLFIRMALNAVDGVLAKRYNMKSVRGKYLNEITDVISDAALYLPWMFILPNGGWIILAFVVLSAVSEMTGIIAEVVTGERRYDGPMGKSDRALLVGTLSVLLIIGIPPEGLLWVVFLLASAAILVNIYFRMERGGARR